MEYYNDKIQLHKEVIDDIFSEIKTGAKILVFGLGYDSRMWYEGNDRNTFFVENKPEYIDMNINLIPDSNIVKYDYNTTCLSSFNLTDREIQDFKIPEKLAKEAPFDIIIVDGPEGYSPAKPGRLIPCYWSTLLSKKGTIIYIDDAARHLESFCIEKFFGNFYKKQFETRDKCVKIYI